MQLFLCLCLLSSLEPTERGTRLFEYTWCLPISSLQYAVFYHSMCEFKQACSMMCPALTMCQKGLCCGTKQQAVAYLVREVAT